LHVSFGVIPICLQVSFGVIPICLQVSFGVILTKTITGGVIWKCCKEAIVQTNVFQMA